MKKIQLTSSLVMFIIGLLLLVIGILGEKLILWQATRSVASLLCLFILTRRSAPRVASVTTVEIILHDNLAAFLLMNIGLTLCAKKILTFALKILILAPLSTPLTLNIPSLFKFRWFVVSLYHEFVTIVYILLLTLIWFYTIVTNQWKNKTGSFPDNTNPIPNLFQVREKILV